MQVLRECDTLQLEDICISLSGSCSDILLSTVTNLSPGERKPAHWCRSEKSVAWNIYGNVLLFHSCTINMALSVSMSSPEGNDSELVGKNGHQKNDYLVFKCYLANCSQLIKR